MSEWISTKDKLPVDDLTVVLLNDKTKTVSLGWYAEEEQLFTTYDGNLPVVVTHWLELPDRDLHGGK